LRSKKVLTPLVPKVTKKKEDVVVEENDSGVFEKMKMVKLEMKRRMKILREKKITREKKVSG
jgi:hypothetical protein